MCKLKDERPSNIKRQVFIYKSVLTGRGEGAAGQKYGKYKSSNRMINQGGRSLAYLFVL